MNAYGNILTPPSSMEDSSSASSSQGYSPYNDIGMLENISEPRLVILEQPVDKFRFRYKSEMSGTHGSLNGINSDRTKRPTYPTVELLNYNGPAVIRCTLHQIQPNMSLSQPHPHRLVKKYDNREHDDPHEISVSSDEGYKAIFHSMGIIHTAKKYITHEFLRKKVLLKKEEIAQREGQIRKLNMSEELELKTEAEVDAKSINLNIVCLRFDAFRVVNGIYYPICDPVHTHGINNLKSALTGELKIVRMDRCTSLAHGNDEVFLLVEKVTKKNIKVRFFEVDSDDNITWAEYGRFNELDVHHQYAIVFRTPAYRDVNIQEEVKVFIELVRPSDGARSEPREFAYIPSKIKTGVKRPRMLNSSSSSGEWSSGELPTILPSPQGIKDQDLVDSEELERLIKQICGPEQLIIDEKFAESFLNSSSVLKEVFAPDRDGPERRLDNYDWRNSLKQKESIKRRAPNLDEESKKILSTVPLSIRGFIDSNKTKEEIEKYLTLTFTSEINSNNWNILHLLVSNKFDEDLKYLLKIIEKLKMSHLLNLQTKEGKTPLHIAIEVNYPLAMSLLGKEVDCHIRDDNGNSCIHAAIIEEQNNLSAFVKSLLENGKRAKEAINQHNNDGFTCLHLATKINSLQYVKLLTEYGADINEHVQKCGKTSLHLAILDENIDIVKYLIQQTDIDLTKADFAGNTPYDVTNAVPVNSKSILIKNLLFETLSSRGLLPIKEENEESLHETENIYIKEENVVEKLESAYEFIADFEDDVLSFVSNILDEKEKYEELMKVLGLEHILNDDIFEGPKTSKNLLQFAVHKNGDTIWRIRNLLEKMDEIEAVEILDKMALENS